MGWEHWLFCPFLGKLIVSSKIILRKGAPEPPTSADTKKEICENIFKTSYFRSFRRETWFDTDSSRNRERLRNEEPDIYNSIFKNGIYENAYEEGLAHISSNTHDSEYVYVFSCFVLSSESIRRYYVTEVYCVIFETSLAGNLIGRFILQGDDRMTMEAFAADATEINLGGGLDLQVENISDIDGLERSFV